MSQSRLVQARRGLEDVLERQSQAAASTSPCLFAPCRPKCVSTTALHQVMCSDRLAAKQKTCAFNMHGHAAGAIGCL